MLGSHSLSVLEHDRDRANFAAVHSTDGASPQQLGEGLDKTACEQKELKKETPRHPRPSAERAKATATDSSKPRSNRVGKAPHEKRQRPEPLRLRVAAVGKRLCARQRMPRSRARSRMPTKMAVLASPPPHPPAALPTQRTAAVTPSYRTDWLYRSTWCPPLSSCSQSSTFPSCSIMGTAKIRCGPTVYGCCCCCRCVPLLTLPAWQIFSAAVLPPLAGRCSNTGDHS